METNYWQIDKDLYKVHISADVFEKIVKEFSVENAAKYIKDGEVFAYDIMIKEDKLKKVIKRLEEFDC